MYKNDLLLFQQNWNFTKKQNKDFLKKRLLSFIYKTNKQWKKS